MVEIVPDALHHADQRADRQRPPANRTVLPADGDAETEYQDRIRPWFVFF